MNIAEMQNLSKSYGSKQALKSVTLSIPSGKIIGLLGPNGSGKTTMIKILTGLISDYTGDLTIEGNKPGYETSAVVSYLPDRSVLPTWLTVKDAIKMYQDFYTDFDRPRAEKMLDTMGIDKTKRIKTLSKGMNEKLQLTLAMSRRAKLYVLDEPIAAVDPAARDFIIKTILTNFSSESSVLLSTHLISDIESIIDHAIFLKEGEILLSEEAESVRSRTGQSIDLLFREVFKC
jgi:ABC-2 type transport system ATP-binding protein